MHDGTHEVAADVACCRLAIVNAVLIGKPGAGDRGWVLVDAGLYGFTGRLRSIAARRFGEGARPAAIILTHGHFDHVGGLPQLAKDWSAPVYAHMLELPYLQGQAAYPPPDPWSHEGLMARLSFLYSRGPVDIGPHLHALPEAGTLPFLPEWRWIWTPGHSVGHVSLFREHDRLLVAGDAFVTTRQESALAVMRRTPELNGPPAYFTIDWEAAGRSVASLNALSPDAVITGHGPAMRGEAMRASLKRLADDFGTVARPADGRYVRSPARAEDGSAYAMVAR